MPVWTDQKLSWGTKLSEGNFAALPAGEVVSVLAVLERQLAKLDQMGAGISAAHLDAAIEHLRIDLARSAANEHG